MVRRAFYRRGDSYDWPVDLSLRLYHDTHDLIDDALDDVSVDHLDDGPAVYLGDGQ